MTLVESKIKVFVKPNSKENKLIGFDKERNIFIIRIKAKPESNKANIELIKLLSKLINKKVRIIAGFKSNKKILDILS